MDYPVDLSYTAALLVHSALEGSDPPVAHRLKRAMLETRRGRPVSFTVPLPSMRDAISEAFARRVDAPQRRLEAAR